MTAASRCCFLVLGAAALFLTEPAAANPADTFGLGSRSAAMAGAVSSNTRDFSANYYNPAGLARAQAPELTAGFVLVDPSLKLDAKQAPASRIRSLLIGLVAPGQLLSLPVAFGLATQLAGDRLSRVVTFTEDDQRWFRYDNRPEQIYLSTNLAVSPWPWLSLGGGLSFLASTGGILRIRGTAVQPGFGGATEFDSDLQHEVVAELKSVRYPQAGVSLHIAPQLEMAVVYRGEGQVNLDVDSDIRGELGIASLRIPAEYVLESETIQSFVPRQLVLGLTFSPWPTRLSLAGDVTWVDWSSFPSPISATSSRFEVEPPPGLVLDVPELPEATQLQNADLEDRLTWRVGIEGLAHRGQKLMLPLRAGVSLQPTGLTEHSNPNLLDNDRVLLSLGGGLNWQKPSLTFSGELRLDVHLQLGLLARRQVRLLGDNADQDAAGQSVDASGHFIGGGATLSYAFDGSR